MDHQEGVGSERDDRVGFDRMVWLEFRGMHLGEVGSGLIS